MVKPDLLSIRLFSSARFESLQQSVHDGQTVSRWSATPEGNIGTLATATFG
jgi:hypothetical protein